MASAVIPQWSVRYRSSVLYAPGARVDEHDVTLLERVADRLERLVDISHGDPVTGLAVGEVEPNPVREAELERDALDARGVGPAQVLHRVAVGADVVVLDDEVAGGEPIRAVLGGADSFRELLPALVHE